MKGNLMLAVISICIVASALVAQNQEGAPRNISPQESALPARNPTPSPPAHETPGTDMPGTEMPHMPSEEKPLSPMPEVELPSEVSQRLPMRLKDFEDLAMANNPTLRQANDLVRRSAAQARQAGLYPNPTVGYEGSEIRGGSFAGGEEGVFVQQTIVLGGKLGLRRRVFEQQQQEDEAGTIEQRFRLLGDLDQRFYSALAAQEIVKLRQQLLKITLDAVETAHQLANAGQADAPDVLQAEVEADQAKVDYVAAQMNYIQLFNTLAATAGKPELPVAPLAGELDPWPAINPQQTIETIVRDSPSVKRAQEAVTRAEAQLRSARREVIPDLQLRAGIQQDNEPLNETAIPLNPVGVVGFASVGVNIPIFNRNQGNVAAAGSELDRAREEVTRVQLSLRRAAEPLLQTYLAEEVQANQYKSAMIPKAMRAYQMYLSDYGQMAASYPQVIISQRTWFQMQVSYVETLEHLWRAAIALRNFTLTNGLEGPISSGGYSTTVNPPSGAGGPPE